MILANARLPQGGLVDVEIADGVIGALHPPGSLDQADKRIDLEGALLLPAFVDGHIHLDKTH
ncbi:MAG: metal-dependent hydrolase, partial [Roseiarcus sp.]